jgi:hypothetical protein
VEGEWEADKEQNYPFIIKPTSMITPSTLSPSPTYKRKLWFQDRGGKTVWENIEVLLH